MAREEVFGEARDHEHLGDKHQRSDHPYLVGLEPGFSLHRVVDLTDVRDGEHLPFAIRTEREDPVLVTRESFLTVSTMCDVAPQSTSIVDGSGDLSWGGARAIEKRLVK